MSVAAVAATPRGHIAKHWGKAAFAIGRGWRGNAARETRNNIAYVHPRVAASREMHARRRLLLAAAFCRRMAGRG